MANQVIGRTISSPYYNSGVVNSNTGAISNQTYAQPTPTTAPGFVVGGWYGGKQWNGSSFGAPGQVMVGGGGGNSAVSSPQQSSQPSDPYAGLRNDIGSAWDSYLGSLNDVSNTYLPQQQQAQQGIADSQYNQGVETVNTQKASSLRDIATNTKNAFQAANNFLGVHGAGDSSAANQYAFAINQDANKQTGHLNEFVGGQLSNLHSQHEQQLLGIAQWFAQSQAAVRQQIASGQLSKSQDINNLSKQILDQAIAASNQVKANSQNQYNALVSWAANNSQNLGQLKQNIAGIPQALGVAQVDSTGNTQLPATGYGYGNNNTTDKNNPFLTQGMF